MVLKIEKSDVTSNNEYTMMNWLNNKIPVPKVLCYEQADNINYLLMSKVQGEMLCADKFLSKPQELVKIIASGLKLLWSVDISDCPYNNLVDNKLKLAEIRVKNGLCETENVEPDTYGEKGFKSPQDLLTWLKNNKPTQEFVLSHGDFCLPNIFSKNGKISGFIDLGASGISDKYQDIALCYRSLKNNFDGKYGSKKHFGFNLRMLFDELEIVPDWEKINFYILLDELF